MQDKINHNQSLNYQLIALQQLRGDIHRKIDFLIDQFQQNSQVVEILSTKNKIPWLKSEEVLFFLYELFIKHKYINCDFTFFRAHFIGTEATPQKITFLRPTNQLPYILDCLQDEGFIAPYTNKHIFLAQHFLSRFAKPISNTVLRSSLNKGVGKKTKKFIEENIMNKLQKHIG